MTRYAWGIDLGDGNLKGLRLRLRRDILQVVRAVEIPYTDPFLRKPTLPATFDRRTVAALLQFVNTVSPARGDTVAVLFPSFHAMEGAFEIPRVEGEKGEALIRYEAARLARTPAEELTILHRPLKVVSSELELVQIQAVRTADFKTFIHFLREAEVTYDRIVLPGAALAEAVRLASPSTGPYLVVSLGFTAATLVLIEGEAHWARTLPLALPVAPGTALEAAREKVGRLCQTLEGEVESFLRWVPSKASRDLRKIFLTGEGARIPAILNALDTVFPVPVEKLRPSARVEHPHDAEGFPPEETIHSMGKALGLAAGALRHGSAPPSLAALMPERRIHAQRRRLFAAAVLLFFLVAGLGGLARLRAARLAGLEARARALAPSPRAGEMDRLLRRLEQDRTALEHLLLLEKRRESLPRLREMLARMETPSPRGTVGDYHLERVELSFEGGGRLRALVATRMPEDGTVKEELPLLLSPLVEEIRVSGPLPSGEETPPEGLAPLVHYRVEGALR